MTAGLYVREGSRFVPVGPRIAPMVPVPAPVDVRPNFTHVLVARCQHGRFARYAARNCCPNLEVHHD